MKISRLIAVGCLGCLSTALWAGNKLDSCGYEQIPANDSKNKGPYQYNEDSMMRGFTLLTSGPNSGNLGVFFNDETPVNLGVVSGFTKVGPTVSQDPITGTVATVPGTSAGGSATFTGTPGNTNGYGITTTKDGFDDENRPVWPTVFLTNLGTNPANMSTAGDSPHNLGNWNYPSAIFGTWDDSEHLFQSNNNSFTVGVYGPKNTGWAGIPDTAPTPGTDAGYSAEAVFSLSSLVDDSKAPLVPGNYYRVQAIFHDSDSWHQGGGKFAGGPNGGGGSFGGSPFLLGDRGAILDVGEACSVIQVPGGNPACSQTTAWWDPGTGVQTGPETGTTTPNCFCPANSVFGSTQAPILPGAFNYPGAGTAQTNPNFNVNPEAPGVPWCGSQG